MKSIRFVLLSIALVAAIGLSACSVSLPSPAAVFGRALPGRIAALQPQAVAAKPAAKPAAPAPVASTASQLVIGDLQATLEQIYETSSPSVVSIQVVQQPAQALQGLPEMPQLPDMPNIPGLPGMPNVPQGRQAEALGSGFIWDDQGNIVTNHHVVDGAEKVTVTFADGATVAATVVGYDADSDLAVVKVDGKLPEIQPIKVADSAGARVGQFVVAIGNPFGLDTTMTFGIISALGRSISSGGGALGTTPSYSIPDIIQTDAPVNPGNSGGVLLDLNGNLIGVPSQIESPVRASAGVGFAIPSAIVKQVVPALIKDGKFVHPWIGISGGTLNPELAKAMDLPETQRGVLVNQVTAKSPAEKAGLVASSKSVQISGQDVNVGGDVITAIDDQPVKRFEDLTSFLARNGTVGKTVKLTVLRDGKETTVDLTLAARPAAQAAQPSTPAQPRNRQGQPTPEAQPTPKAQPAPKAKPSAAGAYLGVTGLTLDDQLIKAMNLDAGQPGVLVQDVSSGSPADKAGLMASTTDSDVTVDGQAAKIGGDIITKVNDKDIVTFAQLASTIRGMKPGAKVDLTVIRDGQETTVSLTLEARPAAQAAQPGNRQEQPTPQAQPSATGAYLGVTGLTLDDQLIKAMNLDAGQQGVLVEDVSSGSPADKAGLMASTTDSDVTIDGQAVKIGGDIITKVGQKDIVTFAQLASTIRGMKPGAKVDLTVLRDGQETVVNVTLGARPASQ